MAFINKEGKLFGKVSIIDAFVLLAIIILAIGIYVRVISPAARVVTISQEIEYEMKVHAVRRPTIVALQNTVLQEPANEIFDSRTGEHLGTIVAMTFEQTYWEVALLDGLHDTLPVPDRFDVTITVRVDGRIADTGYFTHQNRSLFVGSHIGFESRYANTSGEIMTIRRIDPNETEEAEIDDEEQIENDLYQPFEEGNGEVEE